MSDTFRPVLAYLGLGSNLDEPVEQIQQALKALDRLPLSHVTAHSALYASAPVGPQNQPDFINAVAALETRLSPLALLDQLQALEQHHRRVRHRRWGPRTLDIDLLWYANRHLVTPRLTVPHPQMHNRRFVIEPLASIAPDLKLAGERLDVWQARLVDQPLSKLDA